MICLLGKTFKEITDIVINLNGQEEYALEISKWIYRKNSSNLNDIVSIPLSFRKLLVNNSYIGKYNPILVSESIDKTRKFLFQNY